MKTNKSPNRSTFGLNLSAAVMRTQSWLIQLLCASTRCRVRGTTCATFWGVNSTYFKFILSSSADFNSVAFIYRQWKQTKRTNEQQQMVVNAMQTLMVASLAVCVYCIKWNLMEKLFDTLWLKRQMFDRFVHFIWSHSICACSSTTESAFFFYSVNCHWWNSFDMEIFVSQRHLVISILWVGYRTQQ